MMCGRVVSERSHALGPGEETNGTADDCRFGGCGQHAQAHALLRRSRPASRRGQSTVRRLRSNHGVRVDRPLPPHDRVIINPGRRTPPVRNQLQLLRATLRRPLRQRHSRRSLWLGWRSTRRNCPPATLFSPPFWPPRFFHQRFAHHGHPHVAILIAEGWFARGDASRGPPCAQPRLRTGKPSPGN
jgi:hypothetical protein